VGKVDHAALRAVYRTLRESSPISKRVAAAVLNLTAIKALQAEDEDRVAEAEEMNRVARQVEAAKMHSMLAALEGGEKVGAELGRMFARLNGWEARAVGELEKDAFGNPLPAIGRWAETQTARVVGRVSRAGKPARQLTGAPRAVRPTVTQAGPGSGGFVQIPGPTQATSVRRPAPATVSSQPHPVAYTPDPVGAPAQTTPAVGSAATQPSSTGQPAPTGTPAPGKPRRAYTVGQAALGLGILGAGKAVAGGAREFTGLMSVPGHGYQGTGYPGLRVSPSDVGGGYNA
jgi:hypothetical protein